MLLALRLISPKSIEYRKSSSLSVGCSTEIQKRATGTIVGKKLR